MQNLPIKQLIKDFFKHFEIRHKNDRMESLQFCHKDKHKNHEIKIKIILEKYIALILFLAKQTCQ